MPTPPSTEDHLRHDGFETALDAGYRDMAADVERETDAVEWINGIAGDHLGLPD